MLNNLSEMPGCDDDDDTQGPDANEPSSISSWKAHSQALLKIMQQCTSGVDHSEVSHGPYTTAFEAHQQPPPPSTFLAKKSSSTDDLHQNHRDSHPPSAREQGEKNVRFASHVSERAPSVNTVAEESKPLPANDPSSPDQVDKQECRRCKNMVSPGSSCAYCSMPCATRRTKVKAMVQPAQGVKPSPMQPSKSADRIREELNNPPSVLLTDPVALPPSVRIGQQDSSSSPLSQMNHPQPFPPAHSEPSGEPFYPPSYRKDGSSHLEPTKPGPPFPDLPQPSGATASPQVSHHPTDFDLDPPEVKRRSEAKWFSGCTPEQQQKYLEEKRAMGDNIDHLTPHCQQVPLNTPPSSNDHASSSKESPNLSASHPGIKPHGEKRAAEAEWFSQLLPAEQKKYLDKKKIMGDYIDHLLPHLKQKTGRKMVDEEFMASLEEEKKREQMKRDGAIFVYHIKVSVYASISPHKVTLV